MPIEDTSKRDQTSHRAGMLGGSAGYITGMESAGQAQVVNSDLIPVEGSAALTDLGFKLGDTAVGDDLFRHCEMPAGWTREGTEHAMHSSIRDERGFKRVSIFYKAAFYDRRAHCHVVRVPTTKAQEETRDRLSEQQYAVAGDPWTVKDEDADGDSMVVTWRGRFGDDAPEGKHAYSDDGRRLQFTITPDGHYTTHKFEVEPDD
jgi:hypothetical protein